MHRIFRKINHRSIELYIPNEDGEVVGVLLKDGKYKYYKWCGFISRQKAKMTMGRSVKISISRIDDYHLQESEHVQVCLTEEGVFAVIDTTVAIVDLKS